MDISREFGGRLDSYHRKKRSVPVGIFGSFHRHMLLGSLRDHLNDQGYSARLSTDLESRHPRNTGEDADIYNLRISTILVDASTICIFVVFRERGKEQNINQSVSQEAQHLYDRQVMGTRRDNPRVLVLVEEGCRPASLFRGLVKSSYPPWYEASFVTGADLFTAARQFCSNMAGES